MGLNYLPRQENMIRRRLTEPAQIGNFVIFPRNKIFTEALATISIWIPITILNQLELHRPKFTSHWNRNDINRFGGNGRNPVNDGAQHKAILYPAIPGHHVNALDRLGQGGGRKLQIIVRRILKGQQPHFSRGLEGHIGGLP